MRQIVPAYIVTAVAVLYARSVRLVDSLPRAQRQAVSVAGSLLLHLVLLLLLLPAKTGLASIGTTGVGAINGAGAVVTLVEASELTPPQTSEAQSSSTQAATSESVTGDEATDPIAQINTTDATKSAEAVNSESETKITPSDNEAPSDGVAAAAAGAHGQNGQTDTDLWNAIAPCWNRIADKDTLPAILTITFDSDGSLATPPIIERDPDAPITDSSLQSEAKALAALAECGAYPMAANQQNVAVVFPALIAQ